MIRLILSLPLLALACNTADRDAATDAATNATTEASMNDIASPVEDMSSDIANGSDTTPADALVGRWTGVEGMYLEISPGDKPGVYSLEMQYDLDNQGTFEGRRDGAAIAFERDGETLRLTPTDGETTGLRYLVGKQDCLTVASGEGYCRN